MANDKLDTKKAPMPQKVLIIEDDEAIGELLKSILENNGVKEAHVLNNGNEGWDRALSDAFDFIVLDWKLPGVSGIGLINRFRANDQYRTVPVMITSGFLGTKDFSLLQGFFLVGKIEKPFQKPLLLRKIKMLFADSLWFHKKEEQVRGIFRDLEEPKVHKATEMFNLVVEEAKDPVPLIIAASKILCEKKLYTYAEKILIRGLRRSPQSVPILTDLGKIKLQQKSYSEAKNYLLRAQELSADNLERLCNLGNIGLEQMNTDEAATYFDKALEIDPGYEQAKQGKHLADNINDFLNQSELTNVPTTFAALLNAVGISFVKENEFQKGIEHYMSSLGYLKEPELKAKLAFNLALAYLRWDKITDALTWIEKSLNFSSTFEKAQLLLQRLKEMNIESEISNASTTLKTLVKNSAKPKIEERIQEEITDFQTFSMTDDPFPSASETSKISNIEKPSVIADEEDFDVLISTMDKIRKL